MSGGVAGLGLVIAAVSPFSGVPPRSGSAAGAGGNTPAQLALTVLPTGEFTLTPTLQGLPATDLPAPGAPGGVSFSVKVRNITAVALRIGVRMTTVNPSLDTAVKVRGSVAGAVVLDGTLGRASDWSRSVGLLPSGATTTLRLKFKLLPGTAPDAYLGHLDTRQIEIRGVKLTGEAATHSVMREIPEPTPKHVPQPQGTSPKPTTLPSPAATTPAQAPQADGPAVSDGRIPEGESAGGFE